MREESTGNLLFYQSGELLKNIKQIKPAKEKTTLKTVTILAINITTKVKGIEQTGKKPLQLRSQRGANYLKHF